ncbi:hypothetical protein [Streptosporangium sp. NPDC051022]|uniref:hypothetical protein n=1 Tax=Streptosporangium sp. NPDC051022 TaxID=3155752 RepID=UPI0034446D53
MITSGMFDSSRAMVQHLLDLVDATPLQEPAARYTLPSWPFDETDVAREDETLERLACLTAACASPWEAAREAFGDQHSFAKAFFATQPPKYEHLARQRRRWQILRYRWPAVSAVKTAYHRRRRSRRG